MTDSASLAPTLLDLDWIAGDDFAIDQLVGLAWRLPEGSLEVGMPTGNGYFSALTGTNATARLDEAFARLHSVSTWVVLKDVQEDPAYAPCIDQLFQSVLRRLRVDPPAAFNRRCHVFVSSHGARTPLHSDDCNGVLVQVSGNKEMIIYDMGARYFSPRLARLRAKTNRVFALPSDHKYRPERYTVSPGRGLTIPWNWPHEAATQGGEQSVSLNVSFETSQTTRYAQMAATNDLLLHLGRTPVAIGVNRRSDAAKALFGSVVNRVGLLGRLERYRKIGDEVV